MAIKQSIEKAYTLIELVMTITLIGIIASVVTVFLVKPIKIYINVAKRAELVDIAELVLRRMERDIHQSLPNSVRVKFVDGVSALEMINIKFGARYRSKTNASVGDVLSFTTPNTNFNILGSFPDSILGTNHRVVVYNIGSYIATSDAPIAGVNAYATAASAGSYPPVNSHVITPSTTTVTLSNNSDKGEVSLNPAFNFAMSSPQQRMYVIDTPISYIYNTANQEILRVHDYDIANVQPTNFIGINVKKNLIAQHVSACSFQYQPGTSMRAGVITIKIKVTKDGESIQLIQQVHVSNVP